MKQTVYRHNFSIFVAWNDLWHIVLLLLPCLMEWSQYVCSKVNLLYLKHIHTKTNNPHKSSILPFLLPDLCFYLQDLTMNNYGSHIRCRMYLTESILHCWMHIAQTIRHNLFTRKSLQGMLFLYWIRLRNRWMDITCITSASYWFDLFLLTCYLEAI